MYITNNLQYNILRTSDNIFLHDLARFK